MKLFYIIILLFLFLSSNAGAQDKLWVSSGNARLKADKKASSENLDTIPLGTEVSIIEKDGRWYKIKVPDGKEGWMYRGKLSDTEPSAEIKKESDDLLAFIPGSSIDAGKADTSRSIRGLSDETEQYAKKRNTPQNYKKALDTVLAYSVSEKELEDFLKKGKVGEYAE